MKQQRGRKSANELGTLNVEGEPSRLNPASDLNDAERLLFLEITEACSPRHFTPSDLPILISFVQATLLSRQAIKNAATDTAALQVWEKSTRMQATLATRLRLAPQSRFDAKTNARQQPRPGPWPWQG